MTTQKITSTEPFIFDKGYSTTLNTLLNYLITQFKPTKKDPLLIHNFDVPDPGNEYALILQFNPTDPDEDMTEEIPAYLKDAKPLYANSDLDAIIDLHYDHTNNSHLIFITYSR